MDIDLQAIGIFALINQEAHDELKALFATTEYRQGQAVLTYDEAVDGLYVLLEGEVEISLPGFDDVLATLGPQALFGELSLFEPDELASATVTVSSPSATIAVCPRSALTTLLEGDIALAAAFYQGAARLVAGRLRNTNRKISSEIATSIRMARAILGDLADSGSLDSAQTEFETAGTHIVAGMTNILKRLMVLKQSGSASAQEISELAEAAKSLYYEDFSVFAKINSQLKTIGQHLDNVSRILSHQTPNKVDEDMALMDID